MDASFYPSATKYNEQWGDSFTRNLKIQFNENHL